VGTGTAAEADYRGAAAIIISHGPAYPGYQAQAGAFASAHPAFSKECPPMMWVRRKDAQWLKARIAAAPATRARFVLRSKLPHSHHRGS